MEKYKKTVFTALILSEASHIFCCVLPTLFSVLSLLSGVGLVSVMPAGLERLHGVLHDWEAPMIAVSAVVLAAGWGLYYYSKKINCHDTGCCHGPCEPKKNKVHLVLQIATVLFVVNVLVYAGLHRG